MWRVGDVSDGAAVEVAIIHRPRYDDWSMPKGKLAPGESELEGAIREVHEETGYRVQPGRSLGEVRYLKDSGGAPREKVVHYWAMRAIGGAFSPNREVDEMRWLSIDDAREIVTRGTDRDVLERFCAAAGDDRLGAARAPRERRQPRRNGTATTGCDRSTRRGGAGRGAGAAAVALRGRRRSCQRTTSLRRDACAP